MKDERERKRKRERESLYIGLIETRKQKFIEIKNKKFRKL